MKETAYCTVRVWKTDQAVTLFPPAHFTDLSDNGSNLCLRPAVAVVGKQKTPMCLEHHTEHLDSRVRPLPRSRG